MSESKTTRRLVVTAVLTAIAIVGSTISFPIAGAKCAPVQHLVNIFAALLLGPRWAFRSAFIAATLRNLLGLGTIFAFPGSICGALLAGLLYKYTKNPIGAYVGEVFGTGIIGGLLSYPIATLIMGSSKAALFGFIPPFLISTASGTILAIIILLALGHKRELLQNWIQGK